MFDAPVKTRQRRRQSKTRRFLINQILIDRRISLLSELTFRLKSRIHSRILLSIIRVHNICLGFDKFRIQNNLHFILPHVTPISTTKREIENTEILQEKSLTNYQKLKKNAMNVHKKNDRSLLCQNAKATSLDIETPTVCLSRHIFKWRLGLHRNWRKASKECLCAWIMTNPWEIWCYEQITNKFNVS